jgi:hypothetical protein
MNRHKAVAFAAVALDDLRGLCALQQPGLDESFKRTAAPLRGLVRAEDLLSRTRAAQPQIGHRLAVASQLDVQGGVMRGGAGTPYRPTPRGLARSPRGRQRSNRDRCDCSSPLAILAAALHFVEIIAKVLFEPADARGVDAGWLAGHVLALTPIGKGHRVRW